MKIILLIGIMILSLATVGYGASLNSTPIVNKIGATDNQSISRPDMNVQSVTLRVTGGGNVDRVTVVIENQDTINAHAYRVCAFLIAGAETSDTLGSDADCNDTPVAAIKGAAGDSQSAVINTTIDITTPTNLSDWDITVQEIS